MSTGETAAAAAPPRAERSALRETLWAGAHLAVLWTFAVAQPLFDLLGDNPEFFAARGSTGFDIISFAVLLVVLPPAVALGVELLVGIVSQPARRWLHLALMAILVALIAAQALKKAFDASDVVLIVLSVGVAVGLTALYARAEPLRSFLSVLSPAPLVFLALFLFASPVSKLAFPDDASARTIGGVTQTPIVVVLLDEFPVTTLLDDRGRLDTARFPGFAELADQSTWFENAYTIYDSTERAQPAIMDGNLPDEDKLPTASDHPNSIFTLFAKSHDLHVSEEATTVCPRDLCDDERLDEAYGDRLSSMVDDLSLVWLHVVSPPDMEEDLPSVSENWGDFGGGEGAAGADPAAAGADSGSGSSVDQAATTLANLAGSRKRRFDDWIAEIHSQRKPALHFKHALLPHQPWQYLPDGRRYRLTGGDALPGLSREAYESQEQLDVLLQRHILQAQFADYELRQLWARLKDRGLWDDALIVVAADHGIAFERGRRDHRRLRRENVGEIAGIPLFVKAPGQERGEVDDAFVATVDILPTIFDVLELDPKVEMDGSSAFGDEVQSRDELVMEERDTFEELRVSGAEFEAAKRAIAGRNVRLFGTGGDPRERFYRIGPNQDLIGRRLAAVPDPSPVNAELVEADAFRDVDPESEYLPIHVVARLDGQDERDVAVAVNGRVAAVGRSFFLATDPEQELVSVVIPPWTLRPGRNEVEIVEVG